MITERSAEFYAKSASSHDRVYDKPERQDDLAEMRDLLAETLSGHVVLELACGPGYWTRVIADSADSVLATDINPQMIEMAKLRGLPADKVQYRVADAYDLPADLGSFTAIFIGFWWSHVQRADQERLLAQLSKKVGKDTMLVLLDDCYVEGSSDTVARTDLEGNTFQIRTAEDGQRYEIPKNYPSDSGLRKKLGSSVREIKITRLDYYWLLTCRLK
ncbi:class I SAM-dependent methyltransferase [Massilia soli]|uniref:Class I SAM-dependent methyltransferase n=1 Tax=Massilia soli TaxID=2792854 RepID=A0ABS7SL36_9BURK|nr:class I SAM-dependent methyltransferase [Massilia soli]MBZ2206902.1 class I SAM-dependent methyltransferase [Massilia soli]